ncbi:hypothetical protein [Halomonas sp. BC04]|uniref:hypothetical protein n=1 Tax=Halomonas sp. BC04 TaxID=1403540 RepID=UPI0003ED87E1|nr:hypothetical protein Q427_11135 [Halomonas sp. BC04]
MRHLITRVSLDLHLLQTACAYRIEIAESISLMHQYLAPLERARSLEQCIEVGELFTLQPHGQAARMQATALTAGTANRQGLT